MENKIAKLTEAEEEAEEEPKSVTEVVADFLAKHSKKNKFLQNVGILDGQPTSSVRNLQAQLAAEKRAKANLELLVSTQQEQIDVLSQELQAAEQARVRDKEEMQKKQADFDAKLELVLSRIQPS